MDPFFQTLAAMTLKRKTTAADIEESKRETVTVFLSGVRATMRTDHRVLMQAKDTQSAGPEKATEEENKNPWRTTMVS